jgi:hypothetical protein
MPSCISTPRIKEPQERHLGYVLAVTTFLGSLALCGCTTTKHVTLAIYSQPPGAYLTEVGTGRVLGIAPAAYEGQC